MSYFNSLNSFRDAQQQISQHSQDLEQQNQESKAQGIQDKFDYVDKVMGEGAGSLIGLGGGFHIARRVYNKVKKAKKDAQSALDKASDLKDKLQGKKEGEGGDNQGGDTPAEEPKAEEPKQEMTGEGDDVAKPSGDGAGDVDEPPSGALGEAPKPPVGTEEAPEPPSGALGEPPKPPTAEAPEPPSGALGEPPKPPTEGNIGESQDGGLRVKQQGNENVSNEGAQNDLNAKGEAPDDKPSGGEADHPEASDSMVDGAENKAVGGGLKDTANEMMDKVGATGLKDGVNSAIDGVGEALDFLGPIGEIVGAGIAIVGFFRDLFEHHKLQKEKTEAMTGGAVAGTSGISMTSLSSGGQQTKQIGTLV